MDKHNEWAEFFDGHAPVYDDNDFTKNTVNEVDFLIEELTLPKGSLILDVGCGTGRHSIEFARRGYHMTGINISSGMLAEARKDAQKAGILPSTRINLAGISLRFIPTGYPERYNLCNIND